MAKKTSAWIFQTRNYQDCKRENMDIAKKEKPQEKTESLLITAQNNAIRTNYIKAKISHTQQNIKCKLHGEKDETVNQIIKYTANST